MTADDHLLAPLDPDERALWALFQKNIDEDMLREIACADYGERADECFELLERIVETGVAGSNEFHLREVLSLIHWGPKSGGLRGCWIVLFACTALLQMASRHPASFFGEADTLAPFVSSAITLGKPVATAAAAFLAWRFLSYPGDEEDSAFLAFAILLLAAYVDKREQSGAWLSELARWVEDSELREQKPANCDEVIDSILQTEVGAPPSEWLLGLTSFRQFEGLWRDAARRILLAPDSPHPREADEVLTRLGRLFEK